MIKSIYRTISFCLSISVLLIAFSFGQPVQAQGVDTSTPQRLLMSYYDAINQAHYGVAWDLWTGHERTFRQFVDGFRDTQRIEPYFGAYQASTTGTIGRVPTMLVGYNADNSIETFGGCLIVQSTAVGWRLSDVDLQRVLTGEPTLQTIDVYMNADCYAANPNVGVARTRTDFNTSTTNLLREYVAMINHGYYQGAYALWLSPIAGAQPNGQPAQNYRQSFGSFRDGYANTAYINVYTGDFVETGASAGKGYLRGLMPLVLVSQEANGTFNAFSGCFVIGHFLDGRLGIVNGRFDVLLNDAPTGTQITSVLRSLNCESMAIPN